MKAFRLTGPRSIQALPFSVPGISGDEVLIKVSNIGLCGSDLHLFKGDYGGPSRYPIQFGHEWSGTVAAIGLDVHDLAVGDKVTGDCSKYCGSCPTCAIDRNLCSHIEKYGITIDGASAAFIVRSRRYLYRADVSMDLSLLSLAEPIAVAKHLVEKVRTLAGDLSQSQILVYGGGPIGQSALLMLTDLFGCRSVEMAELIESRLQLGLRHGARPARLGESKAAANTDYASLYGNARYDVVIETTGSPEAFARSFQLLRPMGILGCLGMVTTAEVPQSLIVTKSLRIVGSIGGTGEFEDVISYIQAHSEKVGHLLSHQFPMEDVEQAFNTALHERSAIKVNLFLP